MAVVTLNSPILYHITGTKRLTARGKTLKQIIEDIDNSYPGFKSKALNREGNLSNYLNAYVKNKDSRQMNMIKNLDECLGKDVEVFLFVMAGGG